MTTIRAPKQAPYKWLENYSKNFLGVMLSEAKHPCICQR